jgi:hypothetical protein
MGRPHLYKRFREGIVIGSLSLYRIRNEADWAAMQMGLHGSHPVEYQGETYYRPGDTPAAFEAAFHRPVKSFKEFVEDRR